MVAFRDISIRRKLLMTVIVSSGFALLLACAGFTVYEVISFRNNASKRLQIIAGIVGANSSAPLLFNDSDSAEEVLAALKYQKSVMYACIFDRDGKVFVEYNSEHLKTHEELSVLRPSGAYFDGELLWVYHDITAKGEKIGSVCLHRNMDELYDRLMEYLLIAAGIAFVSVISAILVAARFQRLIADPISLLSEKARHVSVHHDYSVRAEKFSNDELGTLVDGFNEMLEQIQQQNLALSRARDELEERVKERTRDLEAEIAERRAAQNKLTRMTEELGRSNKELEQFAYAASHDLQEPLRKIQAFGGRLGDRFGDKLGEQGLDYLGRMQNAAERMRALITDLLSFSRVTTNADVFAEVNLNKVVAEVIGDLEVAIEKSDARIEVSDLPKVSADRIQMRQLFQNLLSNGLKYRREGVAPEITISARLIEAPDAYSCSFWEIAVQDNGIGFEEKYVDRIFGMFQRLHGRGEFEGSGVGLAVCRKIMDRHGGEIRAESKVGDGSTFFVQIPKEL